MFINKKLRRIGSKYVVVMIQEPWLTGEVSIMSLNVRTTGFYSKMDKVRLVLVY